MSVDPKFDQLCNLVMKKVLPYFQQKATKPPTFLGGVWDGVMSHFGQTIVKPLDHEIIFLSRDEIGNKSEQYQELIAKCEIEVIKRIKFIGSLNHDTERKLSFKNTIKELQEKSFCCIAKDAEVDSALKDMEVGSDFALKDAEEDPALDERVQGVFKRAASVQFEERKCPENTEGEGLHSMPDMPASIHAHKSMPNTPSSKTPKANSKSPYMNGRRLNDAGKPALLKQDSLARQESLKFRYTPSHQTKSAHSYSASMQFMSPRVLSALQENAQLQKSRVKADDQEPIPASKEDFNVEKYNKQIHKKNEDREKALLTLVTLRAHVWYFEKGVPVKPKAEEISEARIGFYEMYKCNDPVVKETALRYLIELLECDPLERIGANLLLKLQKGLMEEIQADKAEDLDTNLQRLLIRAYAETIECILLHSASQHLNAVREVTKNNIWTGASTLAKFNISKDPEIKFWTEYAIQAAQHLKTEKSDWMKWLSRLGLIAQAGLRIAGAVNDPTTTGDALEGVYNDLKEALWHIESHEEWFERLLIIKKICRYSICHWDEFKKIACNIQVYKNKKLNEIANEISDSKVKELECVQAKDESEKVEIEKKKVELDSKMNLLYGLIAVLEHTVINSPNVRIREEAIKLLLQFIHVDVHLIQSRMFLAFAHILALKGEDQNTRRLRNTAIVVIRIIQVYSKIQLQDEEQVALKKCFISLLNAPEKDFDKLCKERQKEFSKNLCYSNVIKLLIRRFAEIKEHIDYGGQSFVTLLACSTEDKIATALLKILVDISGDLQEPDVTGQTPYHLAVRYGNLSMLEAIKECCKALSIDAKEDRNDDTALHRAVESKEVAITSKLLHLGAKPNVSNTKGQTPLHLAAKRNRKEHAAELLKSKAKPNLEDHDGLTPMDIALTNDAVDVFVLLRSKGGLISGKNSEAILRQKALENNRTRILSFLNSQQNIVDGNIKVIEQIHPVDGPPTFDQIVFSQSREQIIAALNENPGLFWKTGPSGYLLFKILMHRKYTKAIDAMLEWAKGYGYLKLQMESIEIADSTTPFSHLLAACNAKAAFEDLVNEGMKGYIDESKKDKPNEKLKRKLKIALHADGTRMQLMPIHIAAKLGCVDILNVYISLKLDLSLRDKYGNSAAHLAALNSHAPVLRALKKAKANLGLKNNDERTPCHLAATKRHYETLLELVPPNLDYDAKCEKTKDMLPADKKKFMIAVAQDEINNKVYLSEPDGNHELPLHLTCSNMFNDSSKIFMHLVTLYPHAIHVENDDGNTPLHLLCATGKFDLVRRLTSYRPEKEFMKSCKNFKKLDIEAVNIRGETALMLASQAGHHEIVEYQIIQLGANQHAQDTEYDESALHKATFNRHNKVVQFLIDHDERLGRPEKSRLINMQDSLQQTPIHEIPKKKPTTVCGGTVEMLKMFLKAGADPFQSNNMGENVLHSICFRGHLELFRTLTLHFRAMSQKSFITDQSKMKSFFQSRDHRKNNCLHMAVMGNQPLIVSEILALGIVKVNKRTTLRMTALMLAVQEGFYDIATTLMNDQEIKVDIPDPEGRGLLYFILKKEKNKIGKVDLDFIKVLVDKCPKLVLEEDKAGKTPLHHLAENGHADALDIIMDKIPREGTKRRDYLAKEDKAGKTAKDLASRQKHSGLSRRLGSYV